MDTSSTKCEWDSPDPTYLAHDADQWWQNFEVVQLIISGSAYVT